jgi:hypothetical protein
MDIVIPYLRSQSDLLTELGVKVRDASHARWTSAEKYTALNEVLMSWAEKVKLPHVYTITGGWVAGTYEYALPAYVRPPIFPELLRQQPDLAYTNLGTTTNWQPVVGWELESDGAGGQIIRLYAPPRTLEGQVVFYSPNSRVPTTVPTTSGSTSSTATTMTIGSAIDVDDVGYVKCEAEWMAYYGVTRASATTTLNNLVRGLYGTTTATHNSGSSVYWGVALDDMRLHAMLLDGWKAYLHAYYLQDGGTHETGRHEKALGLYEQKMAAFWPMYSPHRKTLGLTLNQKVFALR